MSEGKYATAVKEMKNNDPPIEVGQIWVAMLGDGTTVGRRIRILAPYPSRRGKPGRDSEKLWIYEEMPGGKIRTELWHISTCPEINLRIVFRPVESEGENGS